MNIRDYFKIGYILRPHGLKGQVTISLDDQAPEEIGELKSFFLEKNNRLIPYFITAISVKGDKAFVKLEDVDTPEAAQEITKQSIYLPKSARPKSGRGDFYEDEIIGFEVIDDVGNPIGKIAGVTAAGPNKLLVLVHDEKEVLIPLNGPFIKSINKTKKRITVELPEGFLDI